MNRMNRMNYTRNCGAGVAGVAFYQSLIVRK